MVFCFSEVWLQILPGSPMSSILLCLQKNHPLNKEYPDKVMEWAIALHGMYESTLVFISILTYIIFYGRAVTSEVEEVRHEQMMPNEERAESIELGLHGHERDFN